MLVTSQVRRLERASHALEKEYRFGSATVVLPLLCECVLAMAVVVIELTKQPRT